MMIENSQRPGGSETLLDEAEALIWALLDDHLDADDSARLSRLIEEDAAVRARYIQCVQLHVDLQEHFAAKAAEAAVPVRGVQVLPNLLPDSGLPGAGAFPQVAE